MDVFFWLLEEQKVIFLSDNLSLLGQCITTMMGLLYPFTWAFHHISPLPAALIETTQGPGALFHGMLRRSYEGLAGKRHLQGLVVVDLDKRCVVRGPEETYLQPPAGDKEVLTGRLLEAYRLFNGVGTLWWSAGRVPLEDGAAALQLRVRGIFMSYLAYTLRGYRSYMLPLRVYPRAALAFRFVESAFVRSVDEDRREYAEQLIHNQLFQYFIENRPWPAGDAFDTAIAGEVWKVSTEDLADFMTELSAVVTQGPFSSSLSPSSSSSSSSLPQNKKQQQWVMPTRKGQAKPSTIAAAAAAAGAATMKHDRKEFGLRRWVCREIRSAPQCRVPRVYADRVEGIIKTAVPDFYRVQAEGVRALEGIMGESAYARLLLCEEFFRQVKASQASDPWYVSASAWENLGSLFAAVVTSAYRAADYLTLRYATEIINECHTYKDRTHGLYECCLHSEAVADVYRNPAVWECMFACSMAEIYRWKYCCSSKDSNGNNNNNNGNNSSDANVVGEGMYWIPGAQQEEYGEGEWALARTEFVYFAQVMEAFGVGETVHRIISSSIVNFDCDKCNRLIEDLKPQNEYRKKEAVVPESCLPYGLEGAGRVVLWVDDKPADSFVQNLCMAISKGTGSGGSGSSSDGSSSSGSGSGGSSTGPNVRLVRLVSSDALRTWLTKYGHLLPGRVRVVTNFYRPFDGGEHAAQRAIDVVRKDLKRADIPVMVFCGNTGIEKARAVAGANKLCGATTQRDDFIRFCNAETIGSDGAFFGAKKNA